MALASTSQNPDDLVTVNQLIANYQAAQTVKGTYAATKDAFSGADQLLGALAADAQSMNQLNASTITLPETMKRQIADMTAEFDFPKFDPVSFVSPQNANVEAVQFVMTTAAIEQPEAPEPEEPEQEQTIWDCFLALFQG